MTASSITRSTHTSKHMLHSNDRLSLVIWNEFETGITVCFGVKNVRGHHKAHEADVKRSP